MYNDIIQTNVEFAVKAGMTADEIIEPLLNQAARTMVAAARNAGAPLEPVVESYRAMLDEMVVMYGTTSPN